MVVDGANSSITVNGVRVPGTINAAATFGRYQISGVTNSTTGFGADHHDEWITEIGFWPRALTPQEVKAATADVKTRQGL